jgi:type I restriction enzyme S subunit
MAAVDEGSGAVVDPQTRKLGELRTKSYRTFEPGDVLFAKITPCMENGKSAVVPGIPSGIGFGSTEFHVLRPKPGVSARYIWHFLRQESLRSLARNEMTGSVGQERVPTSFLANMTLPLPPEGIQEQVADVLDSALAAGRSAVDHLSSSQRQLGRFREAILSAACSGRLSADWRDDHGRTNESVEEHLGNLVASFDQGKSPQCENRPAPTGEWGVIKTTAVQRRLFLEMENKRLPDALTHRPEHELKPGDLLITRAGPRNRVGVACLVRSVRSHLLLCDKTYRLRVDQTQMLPEFLEILLNDPVRLVEIDGLKTGTSESGMNLTQTKVRELLVPAPPLDEQVVVIKRVQELMQLADTVDERVRTATARVVRSSQAVLARAFRGELGRIQAVSATTAAS